MKKRILALSVLSLVVSFAIFLAGPAIHPVHAQQYALCNAGQASPTTIACGSSSYGIGTVPASAQTVIVTTTAVSSSSPILLTYDYSLASGLANGAAVTVTCNATGQVMEVSARTPGVSFTVKAVTGTFSSNPGCFSWQVLPQ